MMISTDGTPVFPSTTEKMTTYRMADGSEVVATLDALLALVACIDRCVNPAHFDAVTQAVNTRRGIVDRRAGIGA